MNNKILSENYSKLVVYDEKTKKELAVITHEEIKTANSNMVVKLIPTCKSPNKNNIKGIGIPIYTPEQECIGHILVNEELQVISDLQQGYYVGK